MQYSAVTIQGNIISSEILEKIRSEDIKYQSAADFGLDKNTSIRDEIGIAWAAARAHWSAFKLRRERLKETDTGTSETRQGWMIPFLRELGYDLEKSGTEIINGKTYALSHRAVNRAGFPVHIVGINQSLDKRAETGGTRLSPHALIQEYLNNHEHLYALTTNGRFLRLLRDATRLSRLSLLEFDLERIMEEDLYAEFAILYRVLHITRMPENKDAGEESRMEYYHQEALSSGSRIRENLSKAVEQSLKLLANGILKHPQNEALRKQVAEGDLSPGNYYLYLLRLVYRILFLLVIEERRLIYPEKRDEETNRKRHIYFKYYSINRLTKLTEKQIYIDPDKTDLWKSLLVTFRLFEDGFYGEKLGIKPLGSGLFAPDAIHILQHQQLNNGTLLPVLNRLVSFENENKQRVHVNYADLDVEEFGSVYEGLLEYDAVFTDINGQATFTFKKGEGRSSSGSHYTPEELVKPLIKHSLDYLIQDCIEKPEERLGLKNDPTSPLQGRQRGVVQEKALLSLKVADVACGSGHILLSAARRIAFELAKIRESRDSNNEVDQPSPVYNRKATRDVIRNCIYGVDLNPLAVELCKVALWLEAHNPNEPLNFLDHHIKCGNSIVGLAHRSELENGIADEAFKTLPGDDKDIAKTWRDINVKERKERLAKTVQLKAEFEKSTENSVQEAMAEYKSFNRLPETTPVEIEHKAKAYKKFIDGKGFTFLKAMADTQVAQFFIPKTESNKDYLMTDADFRLILSGYKGWQDRKVAKATAVASEKKFFHWFIEFPEVFDQGGFDCILGNPPFLGGQRISTNFGQNYLNLIKYTFNPSVGACDYISYFLRRIFDVLNKIGSLALISTDTISNGDTRLSSLNQIIKQGGIINFAIKSIKWPGIANVNVSLFSIQKKSWEKQYILNNEIVKNITSYFDESDMINDPYILDCNKDISFIGSYVLGKGFIVTAAFYSETIKNEPKYKNVLFPYLNGKNLNDDIEQKPNRFVINFHNWPLKRSTYSGGNSTSVKFAEDYPICLKILESKVKEQRLKDNRESYKNNWWQFAEKRPKLYDTIKYHEKVLVISRRTKHISFTFFDNNIVFSEATVVFAISNFSDYGILTSSIHDVWAWKNGGTLGSTTLAYNPSKCFETFPFPVVQVNNKLRNIGEKLYKYRKQLMEDNQIGLTKVLNEIHNKDNVLNTFNELRILLTSLDFAVLEAYGWNIISKKWGSAIDLAHDFYEVDYLPENDNIRYTIHPEARKEILKRLLLLNHERYEEEIKKGLHTKAEVEKFYADKGMAVPERIKYFDGKKKKNLKTGSLPKNYPINEGQSEVNEPVHSKTGQFEQRIEEACLVTLTDMQGNQKKILLSNDHQSTEEYTAENFMSVWYNTLYGRKLGDRIQCMGKEYDVWEIERFQG